NPELTIVARASNAETVDRLRRAGADRVVSPYDLGGRRMAFLSLRPAVMEFFDLLMVAPAARLEEILVRTGSLLDGRTIGSACATVSRRSSPASRGGTRYQLPRRKRPRNTP